MDSFISSLKPWGIQLLTLHPSSQNCPFTSPEKMCVVYCGHITATEGKVEFLFMDETNRFLNPFALLENAIWREREWRNGKLGKVSGGE